MSWRRICVVVRRHAYVLWRSPNRWFDIAVWPLLDVILWGSLGAFIAQQNQSSQAGTPYLLAGILLFHVLFQSQIAVATGFMEETWNRNLLNTMTTPITSLEYVLGVAAYGLGKLVLAMATLSIAAFAFFRFDLGQVGWSVVPIGVVLTLCGWALSLFVIGLMLRFGQSAEILVWGLNFFVMAISGVFNPVDALPGALRPIGRILPTTEVFAATRELLNGEGLHVERLVRATIGSFVLLGLGLAFAVWMLRLFRRRGYITRFS